MRVYLSTLSDLSLTPTPLPWRGNFFFPKREQVPSSTPFPLYYTWRVLYLKEGLKPLFDAPYPNDLAVRTHDPPRWI